MNLHIVLVDHSPNKQYPDWFDRWMRQPQASGGRRDLHFVGPTTQGEAKRINVRAGENILDVLLAMEWPADTRQAYFESVGDASVFKLTDTELVLWELTKELPEWAAR